MNLLSIIFFLLLYTLPRTALYPNLMSATQPNQILPEFFFADSNKWPDKKPIFQQVNKHKSLKASEPQSKYQQAQNQQTNNKKISNQKNQNTTYKNPDFYIRDLIATRKNLNYKNYYITVYQKICPYMKALQSMNAKKQISPQKRVRFIREVVKIYDKVFDFSGEHYVMYCVYNGHKPSELNEILSISRTILSRKKQKKITKMLQLCHKEKKEGNGDNPKHLKPKFSWKNIQLLPSSNYGNLSSSARHNYIKNVKKSFLHFELAVKDKSPAQKKTALLFPFFFIAKAQANPANQCLIGGVMREKTYNEYLKKVICPTFERECEGRPETFQCGAVFNNKCISRKPATSISDRCYKASENIPISSQDYQQYKSSVEDIAQEFCRGKHKFGGGCISLMNRLQYINTTAGQTPAPPTEETSSQPQQLSTSGSTTDDPVLSADAQTEASATCMDDCQNNTSSVQEEVEELKELIPTPTAESEHERMIQYFTDTVFEHADCECEGNDGCKRGCKREINQPDESPPVLTCTGSRNKYTSTSSCMQHVRNAIMNTANKFLTRYCDKKNTPSNTNSTEHEQCYNELNGGGPPEGYSLCKHGLILHHALCALNLDDPQNTSIFNEKIQDNQTKSDCRGWKNNVNKQLLSIPVVKNDGSVENIPLFKKIPKEQNEVFQNDPSQIPEGAIVVMQVTGSRSGHIEIKTGKNKCAEKGPISGNKPCFCSDYCTARGENYSGHTLEAVFQWNPELMEHIR